MVEHVSFKGSVHLHQAEVKITRLISTCATLGLDKRSWLPLKNKSKFNKRDMFSMADAVMTYCTKYERL